MSVGDRYQESMMAVSSCTTKGDRYQETMMAVSSCKLKPVGHNMKGIYNELARRQSNAYPKECLCVPKGLIHEY